MQSTRLLISYRKKMVIVKRIACLLLLCLLCGCAERSASSSSEPSSSSVPEPSSSVSEPEPEPEPEPSEPEEESSSEPEEEADPYPAPLLADKEKEMLAEDLAFFVTWIGRGDLPVTPDKLAKDTVLEACLQELELTKEVNAYLFEQNDAKADLIPAALVTETAEKLFGLAGFAHMESPLYEKESGCYAYTVSEAAAPAFTASDVKGAPDDNVTYDVTFEDGSVYTYTMRILRQNSMPYLQLVSLDAKAEA